MSALADPPIAVTERIGAHATVRTAASRDAFVLAGVGLWTLTLALLTWGRWGDLGMDTGYDLVAAARTADGELPYVDYVYWYGPLGPLLLGGVYGLTDTAIWPAVTLGFVLAALAIGLTYRLARLFVAPLPSGLAAALTATAAVSSANNSYVLPHSISAPLSVVLALAAVLGLAGHVRSGGAGGRRRLVSAGVACGLVAITRPELAAGLCASVTVWLVVRAARAGPRRRASWIDAAAVLAPAALIPMAVYGSFLTRVSLDELLWTNLYPVEFMRDAGDVILRAHAPLTGASVAELVAETLAYAVGVGALLLLAYALERRGRGRSAAIAALTLGVVFLLAVLVIRPETVRYYLQWAYAWIPAGAGIAVGAILWRTRRRVAWDAAAQCALLLALVLAASTLTSYAAFSPFPNAEHPDATSYLLPLVGPFLVWLHVRVLSQGRPFAAALGAGWLALLVVISAALVVHDARGETRTVAGPGGTLGADVEEAAPLDAALRAIARHTQPGEPILIAPQLTALHVMADRPGALPQLSLLPGSLPSTADEDRAIARMSGVRLAIVDRMPLTLYEHGAFGTTFAQRLGDWLERDFRRAQTLRGGGSSPRVLDVWVRKP